MPGHELSDSASPRGRLQPSPGVTPLSPGCPYRESGVCLVHDTRNSSLPKSLASPGTQQHSSLVSLCPKGEKGYGRTWPAKGSSWTWGALVLEPKFQCVLGQEGHRPGGLWGGGPSCCAGRWHLRAPRSRCTHRSHMLTLSLSVS